METTKRTVRAKKVAAPDEAEPVPKKLTQKQQNFCLAFVETGNASEAYRKAYDAARMKDATVRVKASELLRNGNITVQIGELRKAAEEKAFLSLGDHLKELAEIRNLAKKTNQLAVACKAEEARGKAAGLYAEQPQQPALGRPEASQPARFDGPDTLVPLFERFYARHKVIEHQPASAKAVTSSHELHPGNGHANGGNGRGNGS